MGNVTLTQYGDEQVSNVLSCPGGKHVSKVISREYDNKSHRSQNNVQVTKLSLQSLASFRSEKSLLQCILPANLSSCWNICPYKIWGETSHLIIFPEYGSKHVSKGVLTQHGGNHVRKFFVTEYITL